MHDMISIPKVNGKQIGLEWPHQSIQQVSVLANERNVERNRYLVMKNLLPRGCRLMNPLFLTLYSNFFLCSLVYSPNLLQLPFTARFLFYFPPLQNNVHSLSQIKYLAHSRVARKWYIYIYMYVCIYSHKMK